FLSFPAARTFASRPLKAVSWSCLSSCGTTRGSPTASTSQRISPDCHSSGLSLIGTCRFSESLLSTSAETLAHSATATGNEAPFCFDCASATLHWPLVSGGTTNTTTSPGG